MAKKTIQTQKTTSAPTPQADTPVAAEQSGLTAQAAEALADAATEQEQPAGTTEDPAALAEAVTPADPTPAEETTQATGTETPTKETVQAEDASGDSEEEAPEAEADDTEALEGLDSLALRYRVPSWRQAAMLQMQGWAPGKHVNAADYEAALAELDARPLGGGARR